MIFEFFSKINFHINYFLNFFRIFWKEFLHIFFGCTFSFLLIFVSFFRFYWFFDSSFPNFLEIFEFFEIFFIIFFNFSNNFPPIFSKFVYQTVDFFINVFKSHNLEFLFFLSEFHRRNFFKKFDIKILKKFNFSLKIVLDFFLKSDCIQEISKTYRLK